MSITSVNITAAASAICSGEAALTLSMTCCSLPSCIMGRSFSFLYRAMLLHISILFRKSWSISPSISLISFLRSSSFI